MLTKLSQNDLTLFSVYDYICVPCGNCTTSCHWMKVDSRETFFIPNTTKSVFIHSLNASDRLLLFKVKIIKKCACIFSDIRGTICTRAIVPVNARNGNCYRLAAV